MDNDVCAQLQRLLKIGAGEGVIDNHQQFMMMSNLCNCLYIHQSKQRISRSLQPDHFRVWANGLFVSRQAICWHIAGFDVVAAHHALKDTIGASVEVIAGDNMITSAE